MAKTGVVPLLTLLLIAGMACGHKERARVPLMSGGVRMRLDDELLQKYGDDIQPPFALKMSQPTYPPTAIAAGLEGKVFIRTLVGWDDKVVKAEVLRDVKAELKSPPGVSLPGMTRDTDLKKGALDAALRWTFTPAKLEGQPIEVWVAIPFVFRLK